MFNWALALQNRYYKIFGKSLSRTQIQNQQYPQHCTVNFEQGIINLPKIKGIKAVFSREFVGNIKTVTISKTATGKYYASILVENDEIVPTPTTIEPKLTLGMDLGLSHLLKLSDGTTFDNPKYTDRTQNMTQYHHYGILKRLPTDDTC